MIEKGEYMDAFINQLLESHLGNIIDKSKDKLILEDETLQQDEKDLSDLEERYTALNLAKSDRIVINDYIACLQTVEHRSLDISYLAGVRDTVRLLHSLDLIKSVELQEK